MSCTLETSTFPGNTDGAGGTQVYVPECAANCPGPEAVTVERPIFFGKFGPALTRTIQVCPVTGNEFPNNLLADMFDGIPS